MRYILYKNAQKLQLGAVEERLVFFTIFVIFDYKLFSNSQFCCLKCMDTVWIYQKLPEIQLRPQN
jgi:hypothetical protein